jgi:tRNA A37 threonylcarbamoyladenosine synthetase subunit TsaC/SUA5/YrdC
VTLEELAGKLRPDLTEEDRSVLERLQRTDWRRAKLDLADPGDRALAAHATALGAALFYSFGNFCAIAAHPRLESVQRVNLLKGRPIDQVGSVTTTPERVRSLFDWSRLPDGLPAERVTALVEDLYSHGPMGFRGPAAEGIPDQVASMDDGVRTTQIIGPGYRCPSNALIGEVLDRIGEGYLFITSANVSKGLTGRIEAAHFDLAGMQEDFGDRDGIVLIGHADEASVRAGYPGHLPMSTSILAFHKLASDGAAPTLLLERHGSLAAEDVRTIARRHGLDIELGERAQDRLPLRDTY